MNAAPRRAAELARAIFLATLAELDVERHLARCVEWHDGELRIGGWRRAASCFDTVRIVAIGKAALPMARALRASLSAREHWTIEGLVITNQPIEERWPRFEHVVADHPIPGGASLRAGRLALAHARAADRERTLLLFLISGGASALCEAPIDASISLDDLQRTNEWLVGCGAVIHDVNAVRRQLSSIKGGRLAAAAPRAAQVSLLWSDVNPGDLCSLGSGPTVPAPEPVDLEAIVTRYAGAERLPRTVRERLAMTASWPTPPRDAHVEVLADNRLAIATMARIAHERFGCEVAVLASDEAPVATAAAGLLDRAFGAPGGPGSMLCWVGGGEAVCPVRGDGRGGRNQETVLLAASQLAELGKHDARDIAFLSAGTDGIDGNSAAAGAVADRNTIARGRAAGLDAQAHLARSDSHAFFAALGDEIVTGPTGNNLRDLRCVVARG